jgi:hypothetical protein
LLQAPASYIARCPSVRQPQRQILCGMMHAVDEGLRNVTSALRRTNRKTIVIFSTVRALLRR